jgi:3D (Asp-Asp-Asp) domain-containing protein
VLRRTKYRAARFGGLAAVLTFTAASAALAAPGTPDRGRTQQLDSRTHQAVLGLYALDSRLQSWRSQLASLEQQATTLRQRRASLRQELGAARTSLAVGQRRLGQDLRALYEQGNVDPVAVVFGAKSLTKGLSQLDDMSSVAEQSRQIVAATRAARVRLLRSRRLIAVEGRQLERSLASAQEAVQRLAAADAARRSFISSLRAQQLQATQVQSVEAAAQSAQQRSQQLQTAATASTPPPSGKRQLTVSATCYDLPGTTATGMPVGPGVVAVDPSVIPLGTRMYVPGYGNGVAADVGSGVKGADIDLWMTPARCMVWGRRTVTITIY